MSELPEASRGVDERFGPADTGTYAGTPTASTSAAAANLALPIPRGGAYFSFQARGGDVYVRFKATASTAATTNGAGSNGYKILQDVNTFEVWCTPGMSVVDHTASAVGCTLFWWQSSPNYNNRP